MTLHGLMAVLLVTIVIAIAHIRYDFSDSAAAQSRHT